MVEGIEHRLAFSVCSTLYSKCLKCLRLRGCCEGVEELVLVLSLCEQRLHHHIHIILNLLLCTSLNLCHLFQSLIGISKSSLQFLG